MQQIIPYHRTITFAFPGSCLVEGGFSRVNNLIGKTINRLNIIECGHLRLLLTSIRCITEKHHSQPWN